MAPWFMEVITINFVGVPSRGVSVVHFCLVNCSTFIVLSAGVSLALMPVLFPLILLDRSAQSVAVLARDFEVMVFNELIVPHFPNAVHKLKVHFFVWFSWVVFLDIASCSL